MAWKCSVRVTDPRKWASLAPLTRGVADLGRPAWREGKRSDKNLNFEDHKNAFRHRTTGELVRALSILNLCSFEGFVNNSLKLMQVSQRVLGARLFEAIIRPTLYDQFVAGDDGPSMRKTIERLRQSHVRPMIACMMEDDEATTGKEKEKEFYENLRRIINCIELLGEVRSSGPTLQVKMTGLMPVPLVVKIGELSLDKQVQLRLAKAFTKTMVTGRSQSSHIEDVLDTAAAADSGLSSALKRLKHIGEASQRHGVLILIDAEYISMNRGLNTFALAMMGAYNKDRPWIWDTIQCYLKEAFTNTERVVQQTEAMGVCFGVKVVRGAYMDRERQLANEQAYSSPINDTYEATGQMYRRVVDHLLKHIKQVGQRCNIVVATHNEDAIQFALQRIEELDLDMKSGCVNFAQLYGMCEQVTVPLAQAGLPVYKSIPYGSVSEVLPYLYRRASENRSVLAGARKERTLLWKELRSRIL